MIKFARKRYTLGEDSYLKNNYMKTTSIQMANILGRTIKSVEQRLNTIRSKGKVGYKLAQMQGNRNQFMGNATELKLLIQGQKNRINITQARDKVIAGEYINIKVDNVIEKCLVEFKTDNYFSVKRKNYRDSFKFVELMQGTVVILV